MICNWSLKDTRADHVHKLKFAGERVSVATQAKYEYGLRMSMLNSGAALMQACLVVTLAFN